MNGRMVVNSRDAHKCCKLCSTEYGHVGKAGATNRQSISKNRAEFRRLLKRRDRQAFKTLLTHGAYNY